MADRYRTERELGAGGMATVYLAEDLKHRRTPAASSTATSSPRKDLLPRTRR
jgi:serine/threonine protein kinase